MANYFEFKKDEGSEGLTIVLKASSTESRILLNQLKSVTEIKVSADVTEDSKTSSLELEFTTPTKKPLPKF